MGRPQRIHIPGAVFHVMGRGNGGEDIFRSDEDRLLFLGFLGEVTRKTRCLVLAYCLMSNHFHLLLRMAEFALSDVMSRFLSAYAKRFNWGHDRRGHVFQSRFKSKYCHDQSYLMTLFPYIHRNPIKAGLATKAADWPWSSHRQYMGPIRSTLVAVNHGLELLDRDPTIARKRYAAMMDEDISDFEPTFDADEPPPPLEATAIRRPTLDEIRAVLQSESGIDIFSLNGRRRCGATSELRKEFCRKASEAGYRNKAIADAPGVHPTAISYYFRG